MVRSMAASKVSHRRCVLAILAGLTVATSELAVHAAKGPVREGMRVRSTDSTTTTISLRWTAGGRASRAGRWQVYRGRKRVAGLPRRARGYTLRRLRCDRSYRLTVVARTRGGRRLASRSLRAATAACGVAPRVPDKPASAFLAPGGSDAAACSRAAPCKTLARAYEVAGPGDQVEVAAGAYPGQSEIPSAAKASDEDVIFRPAPGAQVRLESLDVYGQHVEVRGIAIERDLYTKCSAEDFTFRDGKAGIFFIRSSRRIAFVDAEFGPWTNKPTTIGIGDGCSRLPDDILLDGVYWHDFYTEPRNATHDECILLDGATNLVLRNSRFLRCEDFGILAKPAGEAPDIRNWLVENNWFDKPHPDGVFAISFGCPSSGASFSNVTVRNNSFNAPLILRTDLGCIDFDDFAVIANVGPELDGDDCDTPGVTRSHNVWAGQPVCGPDERRAPLGYRDPGDFDFHLRPDAAAIGNGHPTEHPTTDIDGDPRPQGNAPDAGADERP